MPKIRIIEKDKTQLPNRGVTENIIFMVDANASDKPELLTESILAEKKKAEGYTAYANETLIEKILELGGKVIVCDSYTNAKGYLKDRNQFNVKFLLAKEGEQNNIQELTDALEVACYRRDCAVVYTKITKEYVKTEEDLLKEALDTNKDKDAFMATEEKDIKGKYVLPFYNKDLDVDAGAGYILAFLNAAKTNAEWLAAAGSKRGEIPGVTKAELLTESEIETMQPDGTVADKIAINPILNMNPWGIRVWGNRTAYPVGKDKEQKAEGLIASSFANIRILLCDLKKELYKAARKYQFEQNSDVLWVNFTAEVYPLLEEMVQSYGIAGYRWYREETDERAKLKARLEIVPIEAIENFDLSIELVNSLEVSE